MQLKTVMQNFWDSIPRVKKLKVNIEMPIGSGLKLQAEAVTPEGTKRVMAPNPIDFLMVLKDIKDSSPWNRMTVTMSSRAKIDVKTSFDEELRNQTIERLSSED